LLPIRVITAFCLLDTALAEVAGKDAVPLAFALDALVVSIVAILVPRDDAVTPIEKTKGALGAETALGPSNARIFGTPLSMKFAVARKHISLMHETG
jgi:hypothetical protein